MINYTKVYIYITKVILAGDANVGKTNIVQKFVKGSDQLPLKI
jgi:GTPase SAR1 family protein